MGKLPGPGNHKTKVRNDLFQVIHRGPHAACSFFMGTEIRKIFVVSRNKPTLTLDKLLLT